MSRGRVSEQAKGNRKKGGLRRITFDGGNFQDIRCKLLGGEEDGVEDMGAKIVYTRETEGFSITTAPGHGGGIGASQLGYLLDNAA